MNYAAILAGGIGSRMVRADRPKQFLPLRGTPIIIHTTRRLLEGKFFDVLYIAIHPDWSDYLLQLLDKYGMNDGSIKVIDGGKERLDTITNVINAIDSDYGIKDDDKIFIHDAVRPFVTDQIIKDSLDALDTCDAVVAADPVVDTMLWIEDDQTEVKDMPARKNLYHGQAPDSFKLKVLKNSIDSLTEEDRKVITGTAQICMLKGITINTVPGDRSNIKITTDVDMAIASAIYGYNNKIKMEGEPYTPSEEEDAYQNSLTGAILTTVEFRRVILNIEGYISDKIEGDIENASICLKGDEIEGLPQHINVDVKHRTFEAMFHITDLYKRGPLPTGSYKLIITVDGKEYPSFLDARLSHAYFEEVTKMNFRHLRRTVKHGDEQYELTRTIAEDGSVGWDSLMIAQRENPTFGEQLADLGKGFKSLGKAFVRVAKDWLLPARDASLVRLFNRTSRKYMSQPHEKKTILFASDSRAELGGNEEFVYNRMMERGMQDDFIYKFNFARSITKKRSWIGVRKYTKMLASCDILIIDDYLPFVYKFDYPENVKIVQAWHACGAFKSLGFERIGKKGAPRIDTRVHKCYTHMPVTSMHSALHHAEGFGLPENVFLPIGVPRTDIFFDEEYKKNVTEELYSLYPVLKERKKVYLYAPTFRGQNALNATFPYHRIDFETWGEFLKKEDSILIIKMHPFVEEPVPIPEEYADYMLDLSEYREVNNILFVSDVLITDYSSVMYEFSLLRRPMYFFAFDLVPYTRSRSFYESYTDTVPGYICRSFASLMRNLYETPDYDMNVIDAFVKKNFTYTDGKATDRFIDEIILDGASKTGINAAGATDEDDISDEPENDYESDETDDAAVPDEPDGA
ncbi:MAG: D-ribitol-5-phosphate cytidylyltransferase [Clostridiales bacterium]|nr:D-ribitol-5-phosphate cytidylyltransferase [Clostridiales bacterium]